MRTRHEILTSRPAWRAFEAAEARREAAIEARRRELHELEALHAAAVEAWRGECAEADSEGRPWPLRPEPDPRAELLAQQVARLLDERIRRTRIERVQALMQEAPALQGLDGREGLAYRRESQLREELADLPVRQWDGRIDELRSLAETMQEIFTAVKAEARRVDSTGKHGLLFGVVRRVRTDFSPGDLFSWVRAGQGSLIGLEPQPIDEPTSPPEPWPETAHPRVAERVVESRVRRVAEGEYFGRAGEI